MRISSFLAAADARGEATCLVYRGRSWSYSELRDLRREWGEFLHRSGVGADRVVGIQSGFTPDAVTLLLAVWERGGIAALVPETLPDSEAYIRDGHVDVCFRLRDTADPEIVHESPAIEAPLLDQLRRSGAPGLVLFSSGSTGTPKAILHDAERFLSKFEGPLKRLRTLAFLLFDHVAGVDTLAYSLASGGELVLPESRDPHTVCRLIADHRVEVLPASPTFLNLMMLSVEEAEFDLSSLSIITYGSEPMSPSTLRRLTLRFPKTRLIQKYGTSEFGSPRALSRQGGSLWLCLKGDEIDVSVVDGVLWIRSDRAMLGYLNAPSPFDEHGWICTGDRVERDGEWIRILGRDSDLINVGGEKVYPREVEDVILELEFVLEAVVRGEPHPLTGAIVTAEIDWCGTGDPAAVRRTVRRHCRERLARHKVPVRVTIATESLATERQKKRRS